MLDNDIDLLFLVNNELITIEDILLLLNPYLLPVIIESLLILLNK